MTYGAVIDEVRMLRYGAAARDYYPRAVRLPFTDTAMRYGAVPPSAYAVRLSQAIGPVMRCGHNHGLMIHEPSGAVRSIYYQCGEMDAVRVRMRRDQAVRLRNETSLTPQAYGKRRVLHNAVRWLSAPTLYFNPDTEGMR